MIALISLLVLAGAITAFTVWLLIKDASEYDDFGNKF